MNSYFKALVHTIATYLALWLPTLTHSSQTMELTLGTVLALVLNWVVSHTIATTTGASAKQ